VINAEISSNFVGLRAISLLMGDEYFHARGNRRCREDNIITLYMLRVGFFDKPFVTAITFPQGSDR
jgi:hypothetical protein